MTGQTPASASSLSGDLGFYFLANILPLGASVVGMAWVLRLVPAAEFGAFNLVAASASILATAGWHWLCQWALRYGSRFVAEETRAAYWSVLWRAAAAALGLFTAAAIAVAIACPHWAFAVGATLALCVTLATQAIFVTVLQATGRAREYTSTFAAATLLRWVCTILFCYFWKDAPSIWWALVLGQLAGQIAATFLAANAVGDNTTFRFFRGNQRKLELQAFSYGAPFLIWAVSMQLLNVADRYVIQWFSGLREVGVYSAIYNLSNAGVMALTNPVLLAFAPRIFQRAGAAGSLNSNVDVRELTENSLQLLWIVGCPLLAWFTLLHKEVVTVVLGAQYAGTSIVFPLVVAGILVWQFAQILQKGFETSGQTGALGSSIVSAVGVNLFLNFILVPRLGIMGAAFATVGAYAWYAAIIAIRVARHGRPRFSLSSLLKVLAATALSTSFLALSMRMGEELWMHAGNGALALAIYAGMLLFLKEDMVSAQFRSVQKVFGTR